MPDVTEYDCREAFRRLDDFLDHELSEAEMELVRAHLQLCEMCAAEFKFEQSVLDSVREKLASADLPEDLLQRLRRALDAAG